MSKRLRDDLVLAAYAVCNGFELHGAYGNLKPKFDPVGIPHDSLSFAKGDLHVWFTARGWRVARLENGMFPKPHEKDFHKNLFDALGAAMAIDAIRKLG